MVMRFLKGDPIKRELAERQNAVNFINKRAETGLPAQRVDLDERMRPLPGQDELLLPNRMAGEKKGILGKIGGALPIAMNAAFLAPLALSALPAGSQQGSGMEQGDIAEFYPGMSRSQEAMQESMIRQQMLRQMMGG